MNALMDNRSRIMLGERRGDIRSAPAETGACWNVMPRAKERLGFQPKTYGADKGFFAASHIQPLLDAGIEPDQRGRSSAWTASRILASLVIDSRSSAASAAWHQRNQRRE